MAQQNDAPFNLLRDDAERCGHTGPAASPEGREAELRIPGARLDRPNFHGSPDVIDPFGVITGKERKRIGQRHIVEAGDRGGASNSMTWPKGRNPSAAPMSRYAPDAGSARSSWTCRKAPLRLRSHGAGEPAYSFLHRLASRNAYGAREFADAYNLDFRALLWGDRTEVGRLSAVADVDAASLLFATPARAGSRIWIVSGERLTAQYIEQGRDRICPACVVEDRIATPGENSFGIRRRVWWDLTFLHHCPIHEIPLRGLRSEAPGVLEGTADTDAENGYGWEAYVLGRLGFTPRTEAQLLDQLSLRATVDLVATCGAVELHGVPSNARRLHIEYGANAMRSGFRVARSKNSFVNFLWRRRDENADCLMAEFFGLLRVRSIHTRSFEEPVVTKLVRLFASEEKLRQALLRQAADAMDQTPTEMAGNNSFWISAANLYLELNFDKIPISSRPDYGCISLIQALRSEIGSMRVFEALIDGRLLPKCQVRSFSGLRSIFVSKADLDRIEAPKEKTKPPLTAEVFGRRLNMHVKNVRKLVLHGIVKKSDRQADRCYVIDESEFEKFVQIYVTARRIAWALKIDACLIKQILHEKHGIEGVLPKEAGLSLFRRADLLRAGLPAPEMQIASGDSDGASLDAVRCSSENVDDAAFVEPDFDPVAESEFDRRPATSVHKSG